MGDIRRLEGVLKEVRDVSAQKDKGPCSLDYGPAFGGK